jgi:acetyl-CoA synthetase
MIGLRDQTVRDAVDIDDARARHRWNIPADYGVVQDCLLRHQDHADDICLVFDDDAGQVQRWSWGRMLEAVNRFANALAALGVGRGDVVAIYLPQRPENAIAHFAAYRLGAMSLPISKLFAPEAVRYRLSHVRAKVFVAEAAVAERFADVLRDLPDLAAFVVVDGGRQPNAFDTLLARGAPTFTPRGPTSSEDPFLLMFTSGTTGDPKAVVHHARALAAHNGADYVLNFFRPGDLYFSSADWAWVGGLADGLLAVWPYGVPVLASHARFDPERTLRMAERHGATCGLYAPTALRRLRELPDVRRRFPDLRLRCVFSGGEAVSAELRRWTQEQMGCEINIGYGQTEANYLVGTCQALEPPPPDALGKPFPGHDVRIVNERGEPLAAGELGHIALRRDDPVLMAGYFNDPRAFEERFAGDWYLTGDTGWHDDRGYLFFKGRADDVIKTSGYRVGPGEVEAAIIAVPGVASCAVIGVPDPRVGETIKAFVKVMPGVVPADDLTARIQAHVRAVLAVHEYPREIEYVEEMPMTVTGKIRRRDLREQEIRRRAART